MRRDNRLKPGTTQSGSGSWYHWPNLEVWGEEILLIFARYPEPGKVKTRLVPALGRGTPWMARPWPSRSSDTAKGNTWYCSA